MENYNSTHTGAEIDSYVTKQELIDLIYPVGSIYISINSVSPVTLFGGTWEQIQDKFLLGAGNEYIIGSTGGEAEHTLTINEMPSHEHENIIDADNQTSWRGRTYYTGNRDLFDSSVYVWHSAGDHYFISVNKTSNRGGSQSHNNMPPYLAVNIWKRTT